jgi:hypothetical protein
VTNLDPVDQRLLQIVTGPQPATIADVIRIMQSIDALLPNNDGLKWFNKLYLMVTLKIDGQPSANAWADAASLTLLDVVFAGFYFAAIRSFLTGNPSLSRLKRWQVVSLARAADRTQYAELFL